MSIVKNNYSNDFCLAYESLDEGEQRLLKYLKNFSVNSRPVNISSKAVYVNVTMQIVRLDAVVRKLYKNVKTSSRKHHDRPRLPLASVLNFQALDLTLALSIYSYSYWKGVSYMSILVVPNCFLKCGNCYKLPFGKRRYLFVKLLHQNLRWNVLDAYVKKRFFFLFFFFRVKKGNLYAWNFILIM